MYVLYFENGYDERSIRGAPPLRMSAMYDTVHRALIHRYIYYIVKANHGAPLIELSSYPFSNYMKFVADVDLAASLLHKSRREVPKHV
jgi:hypothetical protein